MIGRRAAHGRSTVEMPRHEAVHVLPEHRALQEVQERGAIRELPGQVAARELPGQDAARELPGQEVVLHSSGGAQAFVAPALVLLAAVSILQGYQWLHVVPTEGWRPPALVSVALILPLALFLTHPTGGAHRSPTQWLVGCSAWLLLAASLAVDVFDRPPVMDLLGGTDLVVAGTALAAVASLERKRH
jgi:hypothetical protein